MYDNQVVANYCSINFSRMQYDCEWITKMVNIIW